MAARRHKGDQEAPKKTDRQFDPNRVPASDASRKIVSLLIKFVEHAETQTGRRKRKRRTSDQKTFETIASAVICDVMHRELTEPGGAIAVPFSKQVLGRTDRYGSPVLTKTFPDVVKRLASPMVGALELTLGSPSPFGRLRTTIRCGWNLRDEMTKREIAVADLRRTTTHEVIVLKTRAAGKREAKWTDYKDSTATHRYRREMERVNDWIAKGDIYCDAVGPDGEMVDDGDRLLRRYFTESFKEGGRLFGGFWQSLKKQQRLKDIAIGGQPVVVLDYAQMGARIAYGMAGADLPEGDLYTLPGFEPYRSVVKQMFNALLFDESERQRMPMGTRKDVPDHITWRDFHHAIRAKHDAIKQLFGTGIGMQTMFIESQILVAVLLELIDQRVVALPIHDAIIVALPHQEQAKRVMLETFRRMAGVEGRVEVEG